MLSSDLLFSLILSIINTTAHYLMTTYDDNKTVSDDFHELLMMFGITFVTSFILKTYSKDVQVMGTSISGGVDASLTTRPPF